MTHAAALASRHGGAGRANGSRRRFATVVCVALSLHAVLLVSVRPGRWEGGPTVASPPRAISVRTLVASDLPAPPTPGPAPPSRSDAVAVSSSRVSPRDGEPTARAAGSHGAAPAPRQTVPSAPPAAAIARAEPTPPAASPSPTESALADRDLTRASALPPAPEYRSRAGLDTPPRPLHDIDPVYPEEAQMRSGSVVLRLLIGESGDVDQAAVVRSSPGAVFDASALAAFGGAKFSPGLRGGAPVKSQLTIEVEFTPINRGAAVAGRSY